MRSSKGLLRNWLRGRPIDSDFWLLRAAGSLITLFSLVFGFFMLFIFIGNLFIAFGHDGDGSSDGWSVSLIALIGCVVGVAFGQLCHALADIASQLSRLGKEKA